MKEFDPLFEHRRIRAIEDEELRIEEEGKFQKERRRQRIQIATLGGLLIETIIDQPDIDPADLRSLIKGYRDELRLADYQYSIFKKMIREFFSRRKDITELLAKYPDEKELYHHIFHDGSAGPFSIQKRSCTLHFILSEKDYDSVAGENDPESIRSGGRYFPKNYPRYLTTGKYMGSRHRGGIVSIGRRYGNREVEEATAVHEETHAIYDLMTHGFEGSGFEGTFQKSSLSLKNNLLPFFKEISRTKNEDAKIYIAKNFIEQHVAKNSNSLKNEIFAYAQQGTRSEGNVEGILSRPQSQKGLYDYFASDRQIIKDNLDTHLSVEDRKIVLSVVDAFFRNEYRIYVRQAISDLKGIMHENGLTIEQALVYLIDIPLAKWGREK